MLLKNNYFLKINTNSSSKEFVTRTAAFVVVEKQSLLYHSCIY